MAFAEDLDLYFDVDEFAVSAILEDGESVAVIYDRAHIDALGIGGGASGTNPVVLMRSADVAGHQVRAGSTMIIPTQGQASWGSQEWWSGGPSFTVRDLQPDGTGLTLLVLGVA